MYLLISYQDSMRTIELVSGGSWKIGRSSKCEIQVSDPHISAENAILKWEDQSLVLEAVPSKNPIKMNGQEIGNQVLKPGDCFSIGYTDFKICSQKGPEAAQSAATTTTCLISTQQVLFGSTPDTVALEKKNVLAMRLPKREIVTDHTNEVLAEVSGLLRSIANAADLAAKVLEVVCNRLNTTRALVAHFVESERFEIVQSRGFPLQVDVAELITHSVLRKMITKQEAVVIADTSARISGIDPLNSLNRNRIRTVACTPIYGADGNLEALLYTDNQDTARPLSQKDGEFLIWLGHLYNILAENIDMRRRLEAEVDVLKQGLTSGGQLIAKSAPMMRILKQAAQVASHDTPVLVLGESGVGKECLARFIHDRSKRGKGPFVAVNVAAIPEGLFESELFGHRKGAFHGASDNRQGLFREASGGTLFLDEIGDLAYPLQTKLLRVLQDKQVRPVGSDRAETVDVRIICATNRDLNEAISKKSFREDLYYRISTVALTIPPLRERPDDTLELARYFVRRFSEGAKQLHLTAETAIQAYPWPGNVRELQGAIEQAVIFSADQEIHLSDLSMGKAQNQVIDLGAETLKEVERLHILKILKAHDGNKSQTAKSLGISRNNLLAKLKSYGQI